MGGGIVAIYSGRQAELATAAGSKPNLGSQIVSLLPIHLGRITTYTFFGVLIGLAESLLN